MATPLRLLILGAGQRGQVYASYAAAFPDEAVVVGVAEPRQGHRDALATAHGVPTERRFVDWTDALERPRFADAVVVATPDDQHTGPTLAAAERGYAILLEKPMAQTPAECRQICAAVDRAGVLLSVCHVLRYTASTRALEGLLGADAIGQLVGIQRLEPVGWWHFAHSYVRGNWRRTADCGPLLLTKACHDVDWLRHIAGAPAKAVAAMGGLRHFRPEQKPRGATSRCLDCPVASACPYDAARLYLGRARAGQWGWPVSVLTPERRVDAVEDALRHGPYGRCVYACDNDVADHHEVLIRYRDGLSATLTVQAFTPLARRQTRLFGTHGQLEGDGRAWALTDFRDGSTSRIEPEEHAVIGTHADGDQALMQAFLVALRTGEADHVRSGPAVSLETHLTTFAAEKARLEGRVIPLPTPPAPGTPPRPR